MFAGIVKNLGTLRKVVRGKNGCVLELKMPPRVTSGLRIGDSISVNGVCLTVVRKKTDGAFFNLVGETLKRTTLGRLKPDEAVHLERPLKWGQRVHGHFVLGHVDGIGKLRRVLKNGKTKSLLFTFPKAARPFIVEKGSVAVDGVSLTIGKVRRGAFWVHLVPHTLSHTHFSKLAAGDSVNLEADILMKRFSRRN